MFMPLMVLVNMIMIVVVRVCTSLKVLKEQSRPHVIVICLTLTPKYCPEQAVAAISD